MIADSPDSGARSAAEWFAVMRGPAADTERAAFEAWRADPAHAEAYARLERTWNESLFLANRPVARARDLSRARPRLPSGAVIAACAALLTLLSAGLLANQMEWIAGSRAGKPGASQVAAEVISAGERIRTLRLRDGSWVTLDSGAAVEERMTASERRLVLLRGRARFDVAHDRARPFIVDAGEGRVIAHGTRFDVAFENAAVRVALIEGSVEVRGGPRGISGSDGTRYLSPGEQLLVTRGTVGNPSPTSAGLLSWPDPMIGFDGVRLADAVARFNRESGASVRVEGPGLEAPRVSGTFRRDDPRGFAASLAASFGLEVVEAAGGSLVLRAPPSRVSRDRGT
ncbi:FecR domain-containing protein [Sphingopyxis sp. JAI128]|uniref:FecR family protein n=1 Tax=Sphingopyxis sp. JAI128 TaxID=2723066 RepID=UPI001610A761|nr:FecR domain-containing protein [Sphingopyxis sp. JAI128]MBB6426984.1 transmembrane sensor [Sphingopyxis sp. JAI128]